MSGVNLEHASDDLKDALNAQADHGSGGEPEDRGDAVDPSLPDDDDENFDPDADLGVDADKGADADKGQANNNPAEDKGRPQEELDADLDALAEIAGEEAPSKSRSVPHARFNEVNEKYRAAEARASAAERRLAELEGERGYQEPEKSFDFDDAEKRYTELLLDGETEQASTLRSEIRQHEIALAEQRAADAARKVNEEAARQSQEQAELQSMQAVMAGALEKYPFLNHEGEEADEVAITAVVAMRDAYIGQGLTPSKALAQAVEKVAPRFAPASVATAPKKGDLTPEQVERNLERSQRIPPVPSGVGERHKDVYFEKLSEEEFDRLSPEDKRRARGDFVRSDA